MQTIAACCMSVLAAASCGMQMQKRVDAPGHAGSSAQLARALVRTLKWDRGRCKMVNSFAARKQLTHLRMKLTAANAGENRIMKSPSPVAASVSRLESHAATLAAGTRLQHLQPHFRSKHQIRLWANHRLDLVLCVTRRLWWFRRQCCHWPESRSFLLCHDRGRFANGPNHARLPGSCGGSLVLCDAATPNVVLLHLKTQKSCSKS